MAQDRKAHHHQRRPRPFLPHFDSAVYYDTNTDGIFLDNNQFHPHVQYDVKYGSGVGGGKMLFTGANYRESNPAIEQGAGIEPEYKDIKDYVNGGCIGR